MLAFISRKINGEDHYGIYFKYECLEYTFVSSLINSFYFDGGPFFSPAMPIFPFLDIIKFNQRFYILNLIISELKPYFKTNAKS